MQELTLKKLQDGLNECAEKLISQKFENGPLRKLERTLISVRQDALKQDNVAIIFLLEMFIETYYSTLAGGVPSKLSEEIRDLRWDFLSKVIGPQFAHIASNLEDSDEMVWTSLQNIVVGFMATMIDISKLAEDA